MARRRKPSPDPSNDRLDWLCAGLRMAERLAAVSSGEQLTRCQWRVEMLREEIAEEEARLGRS